MDNNWFQELFINEAKTALNKDDDLYTSGQVGRMDTYTASTERAGSTPDCQSEMVSDGQTIGLANCYRFSNLAPSDSDILGAEIVMTYSGAPLLTATSKEVLGTNGKATIFTFSDPESGMEPPAVFLVSVREAGAYDVDANVGFTMRFNFPQTGLYYVTMGEPLGGGVAITMKWETIHPIDQKFLPGVCLPVVELSTELNEENNYCAALTAEEGSLVEINADIRQPIYVVFTANTTSQQSNMPTATHGTIMCPTLNHEIGIVSMYASQVFVDGSLMNAFLFFEEDAWNVVLQVT